MTAKTFYCESDRLVQERIANDLANHTITFKHGCGMYRHWRCQKPGDSNLYFDIITWPGSLCYSGDMGDYLFQRTEDMVAFMRSACMSYSYAAEKCVAHDGRVKEFREERFEAILAEALLDNPEHADKVQEIRDEYTNYSDKHDAMKAMYESNIWDGCDMPSCEEYTYHFLWCLHAIKWFCEKVSHPPEQEGAEVII